jgi:hypothetical protein
MAGMHFEPIGLAGRKQGGKVGAHASECPAIDRFAFRRMAPMLANI